MRPHASSPPPSPPPSSPSRAPSAPRLRVAPPCAKLLRSALGLGVAASVGFAAGCLGGARPLAATERESPYGVLAELGRVLAIVEQGYVDPVDRQKLLDGAVRGMLEKLDPHSGYYSPAEWAEATNDMKGQFGGVGIEVDTRGERLVVLSPIEGGPADKAGVRPGDVVVAVDGRLVLGGSFDKVVKTLRGTPGTKVKLTVSRKGEAKPRVFELERAIIKLPSIVAKRLDGGGLYVRVKQFQERTHEELVAAVAKARAEKGPALRGVLLDLRANPGGFVDEAVGVADEMMHEGGIYSLRHRGRRIDEASASAGGALVDLPIVVLVDAYTASAAELLTGALQDAGRALVVGERTFGKGSVQSVLPLPGGTGMRLTTGRYFTPKGHAIQADGIHPDVLVETEGDEGLTFRESDYDDPLTPEGPQGGAPRPPRAAPKERVKLPPRGEGDPDRLPAREVPADPSTTTDAVLKLGWQKLKERMR